MKGKEAVESMKKQGMSNKEIINELNEAGVSIKEIRKLTGFSNVEICGSKERMKEIIKNLKTQKLTIRQIHEKTGFSNKEIYENMPKKKAKQKTKAVKEITKETAKEPEKQETEQKDIKINEFFENINYSKHTQVNELIHEQEKVIQELLNIKDTGFNDEWEYREWRRKVIVLEIGEINQNGYILNWRAHYEHLLKLTWTEEEKKEYSPEFRRWKEERRGRTRVTAIRVTENFLSKRFAEAREKLARREAENTGDEI